MRMTRAILKISWSARDAALALLLCPIFTGISLCAQEASARTASPGLSQSIDLEYKELPTRILGRQLRIAPRSVPFRNEPWVAGRKVARGTILCAFYGGSTGAQSNNCINLPFLWDYTAGTFYLDLRRDGDLASAPVYFTGGRPAVKLSSGNYFYQPFTNINLTFPGSDPHARLVDIHLYGYDGQNVRGGNLVWRCYWEGRLSLDGQEWQIGLVEDPNHFGTSEEGYLLLRRWSEREAPFSLEDGSLTGFECPSLLSFRDRACRLSFDYINGPVSKYNLQLSEVAVEMGGLLVRGQFIDRLILRQDQVASPYTAIVDAPVDQTRIPAGQYDLYGVCLKREGVAAFRTYWRRQPVKLWISPGATNSLTAGGPLTNWAAIGRQGRALSIAYELRGADGTYKMAQEDRSKPARFAVYCGGRKIGFGIFEYG